MEINPENNDNLIQLLFKNLGHEPTFDQQDALTELARFIKTDNNLSLFLLKGYAGTGKTTIISTLVKTLSTYNIKFSLLAPTGRAAKVMASYSGRQAFTIHKMIYAYEESEGGFERYTLAKNTNKNTLYIVDEASMVAPSSPQQKLQFGSGNLLYDLMKYVYRGKNCRIIFVGDTAQLPPVHFVESPALDEKYLTSRYSMEVFSKELKNVVRQASDSGILMNATNIREQVQQQVNGFPQLIAEGYPDVKNISPYDFVDELSAAEGRYGMEETVVITRSNNGANQFNQQVRNKVLWRETELEAGDLLMVVKNNYFWLDKTSKAGFIANGDTLEITKVINSEEVRYNYRFADVIVRLIDYPNEQEFEVKIVLDAIYSEKASLPSEYYKELFEELTIENSQVINRQKRLKIIRENPYMNALQIKFAYAVTCHKSQGGQWDAVFVDQGYLTDEMINTEYLRWLYTAVTRAKKELYFVGFSEQFFDSY